MSKYVPSDDGKVIDGKTIVFLKPPAHGKGAGDGGDRSANGGEANGAEAGKDGQGGAPEDSPPDGPFEIHAQLHAAGGTPLAKERLRIKDPDSDQVIGTVTADEAGVVRARVPQEKEYHFFLADDESKEVEVDPFEAQQPPERSEDADHAVLSVALADAQGAPLAGEKVQVKGEGGDAHEETTDRSGNLNIAVEHGVFEISVRGSTFVAHSLLPDEIEGETAPYHFVVR